jgi:hypothetical protein
MAFVRKYLNDDSGYQPYSMQIQASYSIQGHDGTAVTGLVYGGLLVDEQVDELCFALQQACAGISWVSNVVVTATEVGRRVFTVVPDDTSVA